MVLIFLVFEGFDLLKTPSFFILISISLYQSLKISDDSLLLFNHHDCRVVYNVYQSPINSW